MWQVMAKWILAGNWAGARTLSGKLGERGVSRRWAVRIVNPIFRGDEYGATGGDGHANSCKVIN